MPKTMIQDFDPESLLDPAPSSSSDERSGSEVSDVEDGKAGREHYTAVGKSKLRRETVSLDSKYAGRGVSRQELEDSDSDDPFAKGFEESSDEDSEEDESIGGRLNGVSLNEARAEDESNVGSEGDDFGEDIEGENTEEGDKGKDEDDGNTINGDDGDGDSQSSSDGENTPGDSAAVRDFMKSSRSFASTLAAGANADIAKGNAVKGQRKTFDTLLNMRIRLQKALIATNSMSAEPYKHEVAPVTSVQAVETAALQLLSNLTDLHMALNEARTGQKRKRTVLDSSMPSSEIWDAMKRTESAGASHRKSILERWSNKTKATTVISSKGRLNASAQQTLGEVLESQLSSSHLLIRTQTPRSCAPIQATSKAVQPDPAVYDDADFYGLLLKELLEQRSTDSSVNGAADFVVQAPWQVAREAKTKKVVDTKASKGRRLRYTVQEKLQNFMAPEERGDWNERQRDELFGSLFGQRLGLGENEVVNSEGEAESDDEEAGLMLFRT